MQRYFTTFIILCWIITRVAAQNAPITAACSGLSQFTDPRDGKIYNTIQIGNQCWMKENLNIGVIISTPLLQTNNSVIEKYCFLNQETNCNTYGGLYLWGEMMQYTNQEGTQGICPEGWKLPTDNDWCELASFLDNTVNCNTVGLTGTNAGGAMKENNLLHWSPPNTGATNVSEFTGMPGGYYTSTDQSFASLGCYGFFQTSTLNGNGGWTWFLASDDARVSRASYMQGAFSVRCIFEANFTPELSATPSIIELSEDAGNTSFNITSNVSWTIEENQDWLAVSPLSGENNSLISINYDANISTNPRTGIITITAEGGNPVVEVTVTQAGQSDWICGQSFTDTRDGKSYNTVQIGSQCWMSQNLNVGTAIDGNYNQTNNGTIEKYCYGNLESNCNLFGGLYQWNEMMLYISTPATQGICPVGWHLPTENDWNALTNYVSNQPVLVCNNNNCNIAKTLASSSIWLGSAEPCAVGNDVAMNNSSGFAGFPSGKRNTGGSFFNMWAYGNWWSSSPKDINKASNQYLYYNSALFYSGNSNKSYGFSVRCLKN